MEEWLRRNGEEVDVWNLEGGEQFDADQGGACDGDEGRADVKNKQKQGTETKGYVGSHDFWCYNFDFCIVIPFLF